MLKLAKENSWAGKIVSVREKAGLSQAEASRLWGFSQPLLSMWEHSLRTPTGLYRAKLERILKRLE
jgi:DNA-binding transcriptional regulator YiaG